MVRLQQHLIHALSKQIKIYEARNKKPTIDVPTRWNSTHKMLKNFLRLRDPIEAVQYKYKDEFQGLDLNDNEYEQLNALTQLLEPFDAISTTLQAEKNVTLQFSTLSIYKIYTILTTALVDPKYLALQQGIQAGLDKLLKYYNVRSPLDDKTWQLSLFAAILDPRIKDRSIQYLTKSIKEGIIQRFNEEYDYYYRPLARLVLPPVLDSQNTQSSEIDEPNILETMLMDIRQEDPEDDRQFFESQVEQYLVEPPVNMAVEPLIYWRDSRFTDLAKMARDYLAIMPTTAPVERLFSQASESANPRRRNRLTKLRINQILCIRSWDKVPDLLDLDDSENDSDDSDFSNGEVIEDKDL
jgi:hypothetical protein